ncbi:MAG: hypothetical protein SO049_08635, partial [Prevotella sp.]|nr:hypothetical protein [Prevotella sp.]
PVGMMWCGCCGRASWSVSYDYPDYGMIMCGWQEMSPYTILAMTLGIPASLLVRPSGDITDAAIAYSSALP